MATAKAHATAPNDSARPVILLDAAPVIAFLRDEPAAEDVERILRDGRGAMSAVNLAEATDVLVRLHGIAPAELDGLADVIDARPVGLTEGRAAGRLRALHYHRTLRPLSLADCFLLASAGAEDQVATSDQAIVDTALAEGIGVIPLANSGGVKPSAAAARS